MRPFPIPIRADDADDESLVVMPMPQEMATFEMPRAPEPGPGRDVDGAKAVLADFVARLGASLDAGAGDATPAIELLGLTPDTQRVLNETLGEGEVSVIVDAQPNTVRIQETVFAGVWREQWVAADGTLVSDVLRAAPIPPVVTERAAAAAAPTLRRVADAQDAWPAGAMNLPPLLHELQDAIVRSGPGVPAHVINLTLLPLSSADTAALDAVLDGGSVVMLSRGFGNCRISSTAARNGWRVQYFNTMQTLILNTIEVVDVPAAALAALEDLDETRSRLASLVRWMDEAPASA
ncbi:MAG TPA: hydrogenase expression/formation C-terminal domain-containing protein [Burkholderiaceae bacterium]|nr:hydrogenase expression/formation C-terminal domain-containing protein [Burkholderiaceae bacterium]